MKRHITYIAMLLTALTGASCSQDETPAGDGRTGVMAMTISTSRAEDNGEYDPLQYQKVYIYNSEGGLLRKYAAKDDIPERLELLSGTYRVARRANRSPRISRNASTKARRHSPSNPAKRPMRR